jgi:predicted nucleic-acid-binding Zn-ribbon protein
MTPTFNADDFLGQVQDRLIKMGCSPPLWPNVDDPVQSAADMIADLLRGLSERVSWRPIETAPKDGTKECPKCGCPFWQEITMRTAENYTAWKDSDGTWYCGPAREDITRSCRSCGFSEYIRRERGKTIEVGPF